MKTTHRNILLKVLLVGFFGFLACLPFSQHVAVAVWIGNILMTANMWILLKTLTGLFDEETPKITRSIGLLLGKTFGLFALCYVFIVVLKVDTLAFGLSAAATTLIFSFILTLSNQKNEVCA